MRMPSPEHRIVLVCACGHKTDPMTQEQLDTYGAPWYCRVCDRRITKYLIGWLHELTEPIT